MKCAYQPFPTQRMGELLEIRGKVKGGKEIVGQRIGVKGFPAGSHQWHGGLSSTDTDTQDMRLLCK